MPLNLSPTQLAFNARGDGKFNKSFTEQVNFFRQKLNIETEHYDDLLQGAHDRAFMVAGAAKADLLNDLRQAVDRSIAEGKSIQWFRQEFKAIVQRHGWEGWTGSDTQAGRDWRTRVIYKTNLSASYAAGRWQQLNHPDLLKSRPYWKYIHNDTVQHPRPLHVAWSGLVLRHDDPWWHTHFPPNGWGCRCRVTAVRADEYQGAEAPDEGVYTYKDRTGSNHVIPKGIDYGWDYAPGASLKQQTQQFIADKAAALPPILAASLLNDAQHALQIPSSAVSDALTLPRSGLAKNTANAVLLEIDQLHEVGDLPVIPVASSSSFKFQGRYRYYINSGKPIDIVISKASVNPEMTLAHEIGHFLDHQAFGEAGKYSSIDDPLFDAWREAVDKSLATEALKSVVDLHADSKMRKLASYYLTSWEQWARSYAQWVATRSKNPVMIGQSQKIIQNNSNPAYSASQWDDADFEPIARAIDDIFTAKGWLK